MARIPKLIHLFETQAAHDTVYNGSDYGTPWVAYTKATELVTYNKDPKDIPGSIAYYNATAQKVKFVTRDKWSSTLGTPIGVVVIPASHMQDGKCRVMSLCNMSYVTPETGTLATYQNSGDEITNGFNLMWGVYNNDISQLTNYTTIAGKDGTIDGGYLPSDYFKGMTSIEMPGEYTFDVTTEDNLVDTETAWWTEIGENCAWDCNGGDNLILSPYASDGSRNTACNAAGQALADMNGKANTSVLVNLSAIKDTYTSGSFQNVQANYPAAFACNLFSTTGTSQGDWYLPAIGELAYLYTRVKTINTSLTTLGSSSAIPFGLLDGDGSLGYWCWSSSEYSSDDAWSLSSNGRMYDNSEDDDDSYVRVRAFAAF